MMWNDVTVPAFRRSELVATAVRFADGDVCFVEVSLDGQLESRGEGRDLFEALVAARRSLESKGVLLACNGCQRNVHPSPMLRQATNGRRAYVLTQPRTDSKPPTVDIFEPASDRSAVASVDEQRAWFDRWYRRTEGKGEFT